METLRLGAEWRIQFTGDSGTNIDSLTASGSFTGCKDPTAIQVSVYTVQEGSQDLFYETIPIELLATAEDTPQITVKSNGLTGSCPNFNCDYTLLTTSVPQVNSFTYSAPTLSLTVSNVNTNDYSSSDTRVFLGNTECQVTSYSDSSLPATLTAACPTPEAGVFYPKAHFNGVGYAKLASGLTQVTINPIVSDVSPSQINTNGGTVLTITGSGFPASLDIAQVRKLSCHYWII